MSKAIGIDLGSTLSEVAIIENGKPTVIVNAEGNACTPSVVGLFNGERKIGAAAKRQQVMHPKETINLIKRFMGATFSESAEAIKHVQYDVVNSGGMPKVKIDSTEYTPQEISAMILGEMKKIAEDYCGEPIKDAVITVPAYFSDSARQATKDAGQIAGLNVQRVIAEPTAAILSSKIDMKKGGKYMVTDFGGSTLDNSVADISDGVVEILATNGDVYCGGYDIDKQVVEYLVNEFKKDNGNVEIPSDAMTRIFEAAEKAKIELSNSSMTDISIPYLMAVNGTPVHLNLSLTRAKFEQLISPIVDKVVNCAKNALKEAKIEGKDLDGILLIGGSCRIPLVQQKLAEINSNLIKSSNLDTAVAEGAAIQANILAGNGSSDILLLDVTPLSYGIETYGGVMTTLIPSNTTIPTKKEEVFSTASDNQTVVTIRVLQGNRPMASDNKEIGIFNLDGIMMAPRGVPQIAVSFDLDANGILNVTAKDNGTGKEQHVTIQSKTTMTAEEIEKAKKDAEINAEADKKKREEVDTLNKGEGIANSAEKTLTDVGDKLSDEEKNSVSELVKEMRQAVTDKDINKINELETAIQKRMGELAEKIYAQPQENNTTENTDNNTTNNDGQETEFEEVK